MTMYHVRSFYNQRGAAPGVMNLQTWHTTKTSRDLEISVSKGRKDIGRVEWATSAGGPWADATLVKHGGTHDSI